MDAEEDCGEMFVHNGVRYYVGWMPENAFCMWINEQPNGGFQWEFHDFEPKEGKYVKIFIAARDPRESK